MPWIVLGSADCGISWSRIDGTACHRSRIRALLEATIIVAEEWNPIDDALDQIAYELKYKSEAYYWFKAIRIVEVPTPRYCRQPLRRVLR